VATVLEPQGLRLVEIPLDENISGIFLHDARHGLSIIVNTDHHPRRKVFSYAHEYCHVLADRDRTSVVSRTENREELSEIRANAFAAAFLMSEDGVRAFVRALGKGEPSRSVLQAFEEARHPSEEAKAVAGQKREEAHSQDIQLYDVVHLARHFGVSYDAALYRLVNLKLLSEEERQRLAVQRELANTIRSYIEPEAEEAAPKRREFRHQLLVLALEAYRREAISRGKLKELCALAEVPPQEIRDLIAAVEVAVEGPAEGGSGRRGRGVHIPKER
jgi:Zn-dependent peptidase ImmA (M78 family)